MSSGGLGPDISQEELDFDELFLYNIPGQHQLSVGCDKEDPVAFCPNTDHTPLLVVEHHFTSDQSASSQSFHSQPNEENLSEAMFDSLGLASEPGNIPAPSPRIEITPSGDSLTSQTLEPKVFGAYRECVSPASSNSSTGWPPESYSPAASPCVSPSHGGGCSTGLSALDLCPGLQSIQTPSSVHSSPGASPRNSITDETFLLPQQQHVTVPLSQQRSRSISPHGKRAYDQVGPCPDSIPVKQRSRSPSPIPSPYERQESHHLHQYQANLQFQAQLQSSSSAGQEKDWNSSQPRTVPIVMVHNAHGPALTQDCVYGEVYDWAVEQERMVRSGAEVKSDIYYVVPPDPANYGTFSCPSVAPLPAFEWPLPSQCGQCELLILQQPRSHHRAHYETEGSRGAVKTSKGDHPEVQLRGYQGSAPLMLQVFIGTADERLLRPHAFYQVHRITGKNVTTPNVERIINGTKVLEIPLEPTNHMRVLIDCVGILKLKNADIELKNGETDIGRKNTRVRLVFRVHIPQPGGQIVSLQVASDPIECSQRSAQEVPAVERQDLDRCSVLGGQQMVLTGQNFTQDSRVMFSEKTQDGKQIWEMEASVNKDKTQANMLFVEVPPYPDQTICHSVKVNFYVINGKKKRSQPQHFTYTPMIVIKAEPLDNYRSNPYGSSDNWSLSALSAKPLYPNNFPQALSVSATPSHLTTIDPVAYSMSTLAPLDDRAAYYQNRANSLINSPMLYHTANQHYSGCGAALPVVYPMASRSVGIKNSTDKMTRSPQVADSFESCLTSRQTTLPPGKSPYSTFNQVQVQGKDACRREVVERNLDEWAAEKVTLKQENLSYTYLEDVNDIIKRDVKGHSEE